jgi:hypothetical protein
MNKPINIHTTVANLEDVRRTLGTLQGQINIVHMTHAFLYLNDEDLAVSATTTPAKLISFDTNGTSGGNITVTLSSDRVTVGSEGLYNVHFECTADNIDVADTVNFHIYKNGSDTGFINGIRVAAAAGEYRTASLTALLGLNAGDYLEIYLSANNGSRTVDIVRPRLIVMRVA